MDAIRADLSVVVVVGDCRERAEQMFAAILAQTAADRIELVLVDAASGGRENLLFPAGIKGRSVRVSAGILPGSARYEGMKQTAAPIVAFLEDHCFPEPGWAAAILEAHQGDCDAIGYTFVNGSSDTYLNRSIFLGEYGPWARPHAGGVILRLPGSNVSFKKQSLARFGERLAELFEMEYLLHESLRECNAKFCIASNAIVFHECYASFPELLYCHFLFSRLQAARRAETFSWKWHRRLVLTVGAPIALPALQIYRAWKILRTRSLYKSWLRALPVIYLIHQSEAFGETLGLLAGAGNSRRRFAEKELNSPRSAGSS